MTIDRTSRWHATALAAITLAACGGVDPQDPTGTPDGQGTDTGNSITTHRLVVGSATGDLSPDARVIALSASGASMEFPVDASNGAFEARLAVGQDYVLHLASPTTFDGTIYFPNDRFGGHTALLRIIASPASATTAQALSAAPFGVTQQALTATENVDPQAIDLGSVQCSQGTCQPQYNPLETIDSDADGSVDIDDDDDDDNGVPDVAQQTSVASAAETVALLLLTERSPSPNEAGVDLDGEIRIEFNHRLNYARLFASPSDTTTWPTFVKLLDTNAVAVDATLRCKDDDGDGACDDDKRLRLEPTSPLETCSTYTVWLSAQIATTTNLTLGRDVRYSFTTACDDDPQRGWGIKDAQPRAGETVQSDLEEITVTFTDDLDASSIAGQLALNCGDANAAVIGAWSVDGEKARFEPQAPLPVGNCVITVGSLIRSATGDTLGYTLRIEFTVVDDASMENDSEADASLENDSEADDSEL